MTVQQRDRLSVMGAVLVLITVVALTQWRTSADIARWEQQQAEPVSEAPAPTTGHMRRRRGQE
jgi:hypothetical protein